MNKVYLSPKPLVKSFKELVTGVATHNQLEVLMNLEYNKSITQVTNSFDIDMFLVSLDNKNLLKIDASFLYAIHEAEDFSFIMMPESEKDKVSEVINFIAAEGVSAVVEVPRLLGKKYYSVTALQKNVKRVVDFSGYVKHIDIDFSYPLAIVNDLPFNNQVVFRGDYYLLELPTNTTKLSKHLSNYKKVYGKELVPMLEDKHGYFEYSDNDFMFILRLVLQHNFNPKRVAELFKLPSEAFIGLLVNKYRYKVGNIVALNYDSPSHDIEAATTFYSTDVCYNNAKSLYKKKVA